MFLYLCYLYSHLIELCRLYLMFLMCIFLFLIYRHQTPLNFPQLPQPSHLYRLIKLWNQLYNYYSVCWRSSMPHHPPHQLRWKPIFLYLFPMVNPHLCRPCPPSCHQYHQPQPPLKSSFRHLIFALAPLLFQHLQPLAHYPPGM